MPDKPFFVVLRAGCHARAAPRPEGVGGPYRGRFDAGWDALREETFARQKDLGVIPADAELTPARRRSPPGTTCPTALRPVLCAADGGLRRLPGAHRPPGRPGASTPSRSSGCSTTRWSIYIIGDNGATAEGTLNGSFNELVTLTAQPAARRPSSCAPSWTSSAGPRPYNHYAVWLGARDVHARTSGPSRSPRTGAAPATALIVHWPHGIAPAARSAHQFHHVIDIAPTVLEVAGLPEPDFVQRRPAAADARASAWATAFDDADAADRHQTQYFEMFGNRGIYHKGWTAVTKHRTPWDDGQRRCRRSTTTSGSSTTPTPTGPRPTTWPPTTRTGCANCSGSSSSRRPSTTCFPLDDRRGERFNPDLAGRPTLLSGNTQMLFGGMGRLTENTVLNVKNKSHAVTAEIIVPDGGANGVIVAQGGAFGGWSLYLRRRTPDLLLQPVRPRRVPRSRRPRPCRPATHQVRMEFEYDGGGLGKGGTVALFVDGEQDGTGTRRRHRPDGLLLRRDLRRRRRHRITGQRRLHTPSEHSSPAPSPGSSSTSGADDHDHLITAEDQMAGRDGPPVGVHTPAGRRRRCAAALRRDPQPRVRSSATKQSR